MRVEVVLDDATVLNFRYSSVRMTTGWVTIIDPGFVPNSTVEARWAGRQPPAPAVLHLTARNVHHVHEYRDEL